MTILKVLVRGPNPPTPYFSGLPPMVEKYGILDPAENHFRMLIASEISPSIILLCAIDLIILMNIKNEFKYELI